MSDQRFGTTYGDVRQRYYNDAQFKALVDMITAVALNHKYTPSELRDAAFCAAVNVENMTVRHAFIVPKDWEKRLRGELTGDSE